MKLRITLLLLLFFGATTAFAVAIYEVTKTSITFYNFSQNAYSISGKQISVNNDTYDVDKFSISSGALNVQAGATVTLSGVNIAYTAASIALWHSGTFKSSATPTPADLIWFIQYGAAAQPYENLADQAGIWQAGTFIPSCL